MSDTEDDILFRIGFESHPQAGAKLEALAQAVEMTQKRIDQMFTTTADRVQKAVTSMSAMMGKGTGSGDDSGEAKMRSQLKSTADAFQQQTDRLVALQTDMVTKLEALRAKDVASADGHAKRLEAIYANTLANLNAAVAGSQAGTNRATVAVGGGGLNTGGGNTTTTAGTTGATQLEAMEAARKATHSRILADAVEFNESMEMAAGHETITLEQRNEGARLFSRARAAILRGEAEMARRQLEDDREQSIYAIEQLKEDLQLIEDIQNGEGGTAIGATNEQAEQAALRVKKYYDTVQAGINQEQAERQKAVAQQEKDDEQRQAREDRINRFRKRSIEGVRAKEEQAAKQAETDRKKEQSEIDRLARWRRGVIERSKKYEQQLIKETGEIALQAYEREANAASKALGDVARGRQSLMTAFGQAAQGIGKLSRSAVLLGLANGESMEKVIRQLAMVQAGIDLVSGGASVIKGVSAAFEGVRLVLMGKIAAQRAANAADALAVQGSTAVQNALNVEALSASRAAAAHMMLARARAGGQTIQMPIVAQPAGTTVPGAPAVPGGPQGGGLGRTAVMGGAAIAGGVGGMVAGGAAGERLGGEQGRAIGNVIGTVAGSIIAPVLAAAIMRSNLASSIGGRIGGLGGIGRRMGGGLMAGAGRLAPMVGAAGIAPTTGLAGSAVTAIGGAGVALGASALAALGGTIFALKSTIETFKDASKSGLGGGSEKGSFNDTVGGSRFNPFSVFIAWNERAELAQAEERTKRMEHASVLLRQEQTHLRDLQSIRVRFETQREAIERKTRDENFRDDLRMMRTPQEQMEATGLMNVTLTMEADVADNRLREAREREDATKFEAERRTNAAPKGQAGDEARAAAQAMVADAANETAEALQRSQEAQNALIDNSREQEQIARRIAAVERKATMDKLKGIEDVIRARQKENERLEDQMKTGRARFGQLSAVEQRRTKESFQRVKDVGAANASARDIDAIRKIGTDETNQFVSDFEQAKGRESKFDETFGADNKAQQDEGNKVMREKAMEGAQITGEDTDKILERARQPIQVELFDNVELEVILNSNEDKVFDQIFDEIKRLRKERDEERLAKLEKEKGVALAGETAGFQADQQGLSR